jgi:predicted nicotinamide N-methyase
MMKREAKTELDGEGDGWWERLWNGGVEEEEGIKQPEVVIAAILAAAAATI